MPEQTTTYATTATEEELRELTSVSAQLRRIDFSGGLWFAAAIVAASIPLAGLLSSGWRPSDLASPESAMWWFGSLVTLVSICAFGWGGCPAYAFTPEVALRQKTYCMRAGVVLFIAGGTLSTFAVLVG